MLSACPKETKKREVHTITITHTHHGSRAPPQSPHASHRSSRRTIGHIDIVLPVRVPRIPDRGAHSHRYRASRSPVHVHLVTPLVVRSSRRNPCGTHEILKRSQISTMCEWDASPLRSAIFPCAPVSAASRCQCRRGHACSSYASSRAGRLRSSLG